LKKKKLKESSMSDLSSFFRQLVLESLEELGFGDYLPGRAQLKTNSLGIYLSFQWAVKGLAIKKNINIYASEHAMKNGSHWSLLKKKKVLPGWTNKLKYEFISDVFIEEQKNDYCKPLLAAEIEASPAHSTDFYSYENDYLHDFSKLLFIAAPKRLFIACTKVEELNNLQMSLSKGYRVWNPSKNQYTTAVLLFPAGETQISETRFGFTTCTGLKFMKLFQE
jgi:hypothetical protein